MSNLTSWNLYALCTIIYIFKKTFAKSLRSSSSCEHVETNH